MFTNESQACKGTGRYSLTRPESKPVRIRSSSMARRLDSELAVPWAVTSSGRLCHPFHAEKGEAYTCPECHASVFPRQGDVRIWHFAHQADASCSPESRTHRLAKQLVVQTIQDWIADASKNPILLVYKCPSCRRDQRFNLSLPITQARLETRLPEGFVVDVALLSNGDLVAAIEVCVTHAVGFEKAQKLSLPFLELSGDEVLECPNEWRPLQIGKSSFWCPLCQEREQALAWFLATPTLPSRPFRLNRWTEIINPAGFYESLHLDISQGSAGPRARYGALQDDLLALYKMFGDNQP